MIINCLKCLKYAIAYPSHLVCTFIRYITAIVLHWVHTYCVSTNSSHIFIYVREYFLKVVFFLVPSTPVSYGPVQRSNIMKIESKLRLQGKLYWLVGRPGLEHVTFRSINVCRRRSTRLSHEVAQKKILSISE